MNHIFILQYTFQIQYLMYILISIILNIRFYIEIFINIKHKF